MKLSRNFTLEELYFSPTAVQSGIHNVPGLNETECLRQLAVNILQPVREHFNSPVTIRSGYRSAPLNRAVGGAPDSQHMRGQAADITIHGVGNDAIWQFIVASLHFDEMILEHCPAKSPQLGWCHISYIPNGRQKALSCPSLGNYVEGLHYAAS